MRAIIIISALYLVGCVSPSKSIMQQVQVDWDASADAVGYQIDLSCLDSQQIIGTVEPNFVFSKRVGDVCEVDLRSMNQYGRLSEPVRYVF